ncbi:cupredoxin family copper-binding protein [Pandoraea sp. XY-2]|uniref:cupredoxin domain-containing protein n=1 Tax=Pandoraea sp. XY-2 TaxID=2518599 RepID=UPI001F110DBD|nr:cupredoxin family copper-binding protein [Pandoraea sp. XY-2]
MKSSLLNACGARRRAWLRGVAVASAGMLTLRLPALVGVVNAANAANASAVNIDNFAFSPATLTVRAGTRVTWTNHDEDPHTVTSSDNPHVFASGALDTNGTFSVTFDKPGTYPYYCAIHPHMTGVIIVK